jgi:hypothetical protein
MQYYGVILHHSVCSSINGKGYDYFITRQGTILPAPEQTDPNFIHVCLEGDFGSITRPFDAMLKEQLFVLQKLLLRLSETYGFKEEAFFSHTTGCPGARFPWSELVISPKDGYH